MKKNNPGSVSVTKQRKMNAAKARRARRKTKLGALLAAKLRPLLVRYGQLEQQLKQQEVELRSLRPQPPVAATEAKPEVPA